MDINGSIGRVPLRLRSSCLIPSPESQREDDSGFLFLPGGTTGKMTPGSCSFPGGAEDSCSFPGGTTGKVAPPRNEAETDGASTHQPNLYPRAHGPLRLDPKPSRPLARSAPRASPPGEAQERGGEGGRFPPTKALCAGTALDSAHGFSD